jgi:hypothetical protein
MKKFGTPIGAAPGRANENDGLLGLGLPLLEPFLPPFLFFELELFVVVVVVVVVCDPLPPLGWLDVVVVVVWVVPRCGCGCPVWRGGVCVWLLVVVVDVELDEVEVEVEDEEEDEEELPVVVVGGGAHDTELEAMGPAVRLEAGVPAGTFGNVSTWPVMSFTVTVHVPAASATGIKARACTARTVLAAAMATLSLRRLMTLAWLLPPRWRTQH